MANIDKSITKVAPKIDVGKALELRLKGLSYRDIAVFFGCSHTSVAERLKPYVNGDDVDLETFKKNRADILTMKQAQVLGSMTKEDIEKASARDKAIVFGTLYDKERLERGLSTSNAAVVYAAAVEAAFAKPDNFDETSQGEGDN